MAVSLIVMLSVVLLLSDLAGRRPGTAAIHHQAAGSLSLDYVANVALITLVENITLEEAARGVEAGLQQSGLMAGEHYVLKKYSAQGEIAMLPQIIETVLSDNPHAIVTITTPALIATMPRVKEIPLIFTVASDPRVLSLFSGQRPANLCGYYDEPPLGELLQMAAAYTKGLKAVGIVYDAAQENSRISAGKLREAGREQGIRVLEATASVVSDLAMASQSLIQRGAQAIILASDNLVSTGFSSIHRVASPAKIPLFVTDLELMQLGATGALGYNFFEWGRHSGLLAARVLAGASPAELPMEAIPFERMDPGGKTTSPATGKMFNLRLVHYSDTEFSEEASRGLFDGLKQAGMQQGKHYQLKTYNAQGDMSTLSSIMTNVRADRPDLLVVISTPALQAALRQIGPDINIVFTAVGDAVRAGAGRSETDHLPNVTGITTSSPFEEMARLIRQVLPSTRRVGTLFTPAEVNSVIYKDRLAEALQAEGMELLALPVTAVADVTQAAIDMCGKDIQLVAQVVDNFTRPSFGLIARKAAEKGIPCFVFDSSQMNTGGTLCLARDYYDAGVEAAEKVVRILNGESPARIPFNNTRSQKLMINYELASRYKLQISPELKEKAQAFEPQMASP